MRVALDTNRYVDLARGEPEACQTLEGASEILVPFVVLGELRAGFAVGDRRLDNEQRLAAFLREPGVSVLWADERTLDHYAALFHQLRVQGTPIPTNNLWIAALTLQNGAVLYSRDHHFALLPQLSMI